MDQGLLIQGLELMLFGMTAVGLFLTLLVITVTLSSKLLSRWFPESEPATGPGACSSSRPGGAAPGQPAPEVIAAITAALHQHRSQRH